MLSTTLLQTLLLSALPLITADSVGSTTRYWDCCKPSCAWPGKASVSNPVNTCDVHNSPLTDPNAASGCNGGSSYMCGDQTPWAVSDTLAYGFAAAKLAGGSEASWCCACYELTFTSGAVAGQKFVVQATNTGGDLGDNHFDLAIPGGGFGIFNGCTAEYGTPAGGWGAQYGGISSRSQCDSFAPALQAGCYWRFDWFKNADNPAVTFKQVTCPAALTAKSGCVRSGETPTGSSSVGTVAASGSSSTASAAPASSKTTTASSKPASVVTTKSTTPAAAAPSSNPSSPASSNPSSYPSASAAAKWGQCGGINWKGATTCVSGTTCQKQNDYYFQCL